MPYLTLTLRVVALILAPGALRRALAPMWLAAAALVHVKPDGASLRAYAWGLALVPAHELLGFDNGWSMVSVVDEQLALVQHADVSPKGKQSACPP